MPDLTPQPVEVRPINAQQTRHLRHTVLRPHQTLADMVYDCDRLPDTLHLGAFVVGDDQAGPIGIVSFAPEPMPADPRSGDWRLRGMAVESGWQGRGVGKLIVRGCLQSVAEKGGQRVWCNARVSAMPFYASLGFTARGERFDIPMIGEHDVMHIAVAAASR